MKNCNKVVFDGFQPTTEDQVHIRNYILDTKTCNQLCKEFIAAKSYFYNRQTLVCQCLSETIHEIEEHVLKVGAPQGCPANFVQNTCVIHFVKLYTYQVWFIKTTFKIWIKLNPWKTYVSIFFQILIALVEIEFNVSSALKFLIFLSLGQRWTKVNAVGIIWICFMNTY